MQTDHPVSDADQHPGALRIVPAAPVAVSVFDLDRTLTRHGTWSPILLMAAWRLAPWRLLLVPVVPLAMIAYKAKLIERETLKSFMQRCMMGGRVPARSVRALASAFAERLTRRQCHAEGIAQIAMDRAAGRRVILASAANRFYLDAIAARLGVTEIIGTECRWQDGYLLPGVKGFNCYGAMKARMFLDYAAAEGLSPDAMHIRVYTDHASDAPLLELADEPVAVNPSSKLRALAAERGWAIVKWSG